MHACMLKCPILILVDTVKRKKRVWCVCSWYAFQSTLSVEYHQNALVTKAELLMQRIDGAPLSGKQKVKNYHYAMPAKISWT